MNYWDHKSIFWNVALLVITHKNISYMYIYIYIYIYVHLHNVSKYQISKPGCHVTFLLKYK